MRQNQIRAATVIPGCRGAIIRFLRLVQISFALVFLSAAISEAAPEQITAPEAQEMIESGDLILIDIRTPEEWAETGHPAGSVMLDMRGKDFLRYLVAIRKARPEKTIGFICATGGRTGYLTRFLEKNGFLGTVDVSEGMMGSRKGPGWLKHGLPLEKADHSENGERLKDILSGE